jgi:hypothetical protein
MSKEIAVQNSSVKRKPYATHDWYEAFLEAYMESGLVAHSAAKAGVSPEAVYKARDRDKDFAEAYQMARRIVAGELEGEGIRRARNHSDTLLIFLLKGLMPDVYGDKVLHGHTGQVNIKLVYDE